MTHFGEHLMIDGYGGSYEKLNDREIVFRCLNELPEDLGMTKLTTPAVFEAPGNDGKDPGGWSGFVVIAESHISIHTFPARGFVSIDVYTCKNGLDNRHTVKYFKEAFDLQDTEENFVERGKKYPATNFPR
ncbi:MAG: adenosylmethionine decarboxylase [Candidatus Moraniibacteriota bacterium]